MVLAREVFHQPVAAFAHLLTLDDLDDWELEFQLRGSPERRADLRAAIIAHTMATAPAHHHRLREQVPTVDDFIAQPPADDPTEPAADLAAKLANLDAILRSTLR